MCHNTMPFGEVLLLEAILEELWGIIKSRLDGGHEVNDHDVAVDKTDRAGLVL